MTRYVRFTHDASVPVAAADSHPAVQRGILIDGELIRTADGMEVKRAAVRLLPCVSPSKIVCVGRNYADHAKELGNEVPAEPIIFLKPPSSLNAHGAPVVFPSLSKLLSFEGELGLVIGRRSRNLTRSEAWMAVAGFTAVNDVTARDLQKRDGQWTRGKGFDTFCPVGPWWVPRDEVDFASIRVRAHVNGEVKQDGSVADMLFGVDAILEYVTQFMTIEPGDLIATGTPPGVGGLEVGDVVSVEVSGVGVLDNPVVAGQVRAG
ncbi:MAG TPA: fumarylacetoacetate hydrolase family protein [Bryobacteraceae bacterium]|nr:fumarylacetoacetate hydrolase family protein [Bryobacteraceae bacterium]